MTSKLRSDFLENPKTDESLSGEKKTAVSALMHVLFHSLQLYSHMDDYIMVILMFAAE